MEDPCFTVLEEVFCVFAYIFVFLCLYLWICVHLDSNTSTVYDHEATLNGGSIISLQFGYLFLSFCICIFYLYLQLSSILCQCGDANVVYDYGAKPWMGNRWLTITLGNRNPQIYHRMAKLARIGKKTMTTAKVDKLSNTQNRLNGICWIIWFTHDVLSRIRQTLSDIPEM